VKQLYLLLSLFIVCGLQAQDKIILQGKVTNEKDVEGIHILNTSSRFNSVTDLYGNFAITVKQGDTLRFSSVHYALKDKVVTPEIFEKSLMIVTLEPLINELDEVVIGPNLTGYLGTDIKDIEVEDPKNFKDYGLPGFEGVPQERIVPIGQAIGLTSVNIEALYNHISGYYRKLRLRRKWEGEDTAVARLLFTYNSKFLNDSYGIPENRSYDFMLFCVETTQVSRLYASKNYLEVLTLLESQSKVYVDRMNSKEE
jgi:hypothetical protein